MPHIRVAALTHRGGVRTANEDCIAVGNQIAQRCMSAPLHLETELDGALLCVVADGMGGHAAGEVASLLAVRRIVETWHHISNAEQLSTALSELNCTVFNAMKGDLASLGMGTTIAGVILREGEALVFNIGDSRVYTRNGRFLRLLSTDDTTARVAGHERTGQVSHALTQCLGGARNFEPVSPHVLTLPLGKQARFLLCSDGLTDMLDQDAIEACLRDDPVATADDLFAASMAAGGDDNISIIIADYEADTKRTGRATERFALSGQCRRGGAQESFRRYR
jgi:serine/threonine protein phosphatase PrpC